MSDIPIEVVNWFNANVSQHLLVDSCMRQNPNGMIEGWIANNRIDLWTISEKKCVNSFQASYHPNLDLWSPGVNNSGFWFELYQIAPQHEIVTETGETQFYWSTNDVITMMHNFVSESLRESDLLLTLRHKNEMFLRKHVKPVSLFVTDKSIPTPAHISAKRTVSVSLFD